MDASEVESLVARTRASLEGEHPRQQVLQKDELAARLRTEYEDGRAPAEARQAADQLDREVGRTLQANPNLRWPASTSVSLRPDTKSSRELRAQHGLTEGPQAATRSTPGVVRGRALTQDEQRQAGETVYLLEESKQRSVDERLAAARAEFRSEAQTHTEEPRPDYSHSRTQQVERDR